LLIVEQTHTNHVMKTMFVNAKIVMLHVKLVTHLTIVIHANLATVTFTKEIVLTHAQIHTGQIMKESAQNVMILAKLATDSDQMNAQLVNQVKDIFPELLVSLNAQTELGQTKILPLVRNVTPHVKHVMLPPIKDVTNVLKDTSHNQITENIVSKLAQMDISKTQLHTLVMLAMTLVLLAQEMVKTTVTHVLENTISTNNNVSTHV
jgi:formate dehydrogenase maturation protein FdhE